MPLLGNPRCNGNGTGLGDDTATLSPGTAALFNMLQPLEQAGANLITAGAIQPGTAYTFSPTGAISQVVPASAVGTMGSSSVSTLLVLGLGVLAMFLVMNAAKAGRG